MKEKTIEFETLSLPFTIEEDSWQLNLAKSQTRVKDPRQIRLLSEVTGDAFVPVEVTEDKDSFNFTFTVEQTKKKWEDLGSLHRNEKLRLLCNVAQLKKYLHHRVSFFLHPDNLVFDDNLMPFIIYRGIRDLIPPFEMSEQRFLKQLQCFTIALFSQKYSFEQLYNGALKDAKETEFQRQVSEMTELDALIDYLQESYTHEQKKTEKEMQMFSIKRFRLFKQLSIIMIVVAVLLAAPLIYFGFFNVPYQQSLLDAHNDYLASDYGGVISTLENEKADKLPKSAKYILAHSYIIAEDLREDQEEAVMNNVSLKSDDDYLLYWIYNGRGELDDAMDKAKYIGDPELILHGLYQQKDEVNNDPDLDASERDEKEEEIDNEIEEIKEENGLGEDEEEKEEAERADSDEQQDSEDEEKDSDDDEDDEDEEKD